MRAVRGKFENTGSSVIFSVDSRFERLNYSLLPEKGGYFVVSFGGRDPLNNTLNFSFGFCFYNLNHKVSYSDVV